MPPIVVIVGPPGAGKSSVGPVVARALGTTFTDTDAEIERRAGRSVADLFVDDGEPAFRELERDVVADVLRDDVGVVALGGGAVESPATQDSLADQYVIRLTVGASEAAKRVGITGARPVLLGNVRTTWSALLQRREPAYERVATVTVATDRRSADDVAAEIVSHVKEARV